MIQLPIIDNSPVHAMFTSQTIIIVARSALYVRAHSQNWNVSPFVRPFVRKVITFCEEDMRGDHVPLDLGVLNDRFFGFEKILKSFEKF